MRVKQESEKAGLKLDIKKNKITASSPITSWQTDGEKVDTVIDSIFLGSKITGDDDCSHDIKRRLLLGKKCYDKPGCSCCCCSVAQLCLTFCNPKDCCTPA